MSNADERALWLQRARVVTLPGLDGSGLLHEPWVAQMPDWLSRQVVSYPQDRLLRYEALADWVAQRVEGEADEPVVLVGESFGGPLALRVAERLGDRVKAVVLVATFGSAPMRPWVCRALSVLVCCGPVMDWVLRLTMGDGQTSQALIDLARRAVTQPRRRVLAGRIREVARVRSDAQLRALAAPVMYVRATRDRLVGPDSLEKLLRVRPNIHAESFDAPHMVMQQEATATWAAVQRWLEGLEGDR